MEANKVVSIFRVQLYILAVTHWPSTWFNKLLGLVDTAKQLKMGQSQYLTISADRGNPLYWSQPIFSELKKSLLTFIKCETNKTLNGLNFR